MAMRNWWIEATIDGRKTKLQGGPQRVDGGFELTIRQRDKGASVQTLEVQGVVLEGGRLQLIVNEIGANGARNLARNITVTTER